MTSLQCVTKEAAWAAVVGLDWADQKHDIVLHATGSAPDEHQQLVHTPEAIDEWACGLRERFGGRPVAVCFEQTRGPIAYALLKYDFLVLAPLPPARLASYRQAFHASGAKDDPTDAALLLDYALRHPDQLRVWQPDTAETRELRLLAETRRRIVDQRTAFSNQLTAALKQYFPQALLLAGEELHAPLACDFLARWPTLEAVQRASSATLRKFYYAHGCRSETRIAERLALLSTARPLTDDPAVIHAALFLLRFLIGQLRALHKPLAHIERHIQQLMARHPDGPLFSALPGAGDVLAPRLLVAFGSDRQRFASAAELQTFSGVAPVTKRSGKRSVVHRRWACPKFLLQTFHEFAHWSRRKSPWAAAFYRQQRATGKGHHAALRTLAFKWIRILFRCWKTRTPYCEQTYLASLQKRTAPLLAFLEPSPNPCA